jgi:endonuclease/exonuclease/phosphatase family metal-dependent hydrolase
MHGSVRFAAILDCLVGLGADVVCLQEVNSEFLEMMRAHKGVRSKFGYFGGGEEGADISPQTWYGCLILFNRDTVAASDMRVEYSDSPVPGEGTNQGRHLLYATFSGVKGKTTEGLAGFKVGTSHVESPTPQHRSQAERQRQLGEAKTILSAGAQGAIFCGDTNVSPQDEAAFPPSLDWWREHDLWLRAGRDHSTPTFGVTYPVLEAPKRLDRLVMVDPSRPYEVVKVELFGNERVHVSDARYAGMVVYMSDHNGVYATVRFG